MAFKDWSATAADNDDADGNINWAEGQAPSTVNGSARSMMAALKSALGFIVNVKDYGAVIDGVTNDSAAWQSAISAVDAAGGGFVFHPGGTSMGVSISTSDNSHVHIIGAGRSSVIKKNANGAAVILGKECSMSGIYIDGDGANFTGVGVLINTGSLDQTSWRQIDNCFIFDTASYGIEFSGNRAGYASQVSHCRIVPRTASVAAVKWPTLGSSESNGNRSLMDVWSASNPICDISDANDGQIVNCQGAGPTMTVNSQKICITGCRIVDYSGGSGWTITGTNHAITGNTVSLTAGANVITFGAGMVSCNFTGNSLGSSTTITDSAPGASQSNQIDYRRQISVPTWTASGGATSIGSGSLSTAYSRRGEWCIADLNLNGAADTNWSSGFYTFTLPFTASRDATSAILVNDSDGAFYVGSAKIIGGTNTVRFNLASNTTNFLGAAVPITWATADKLYAQLIFLIQ